MERESDVSDKVIPSVTFASRIICSSSPEQEIIRYWYSRSAVQAPKFVHDEYGKQTALRPMPRWFKVP